MTLVAVGRRRAILAMVSAAFFVDMLVYGIVVPVLPHVAISAGLDYSGVGSVFGCYGAAYLVMTPVVGWLTDRHGVRAVFVAGGILLMLATLVFAQARFPALLVSARLLQGLGAAATWVAGYATLGRVFAQPERGRAVGTASIGTAFGVFSGPMLGGALVEVGGLDAPFLLSAGLVAMVTVMLAAILPPSTLLLPPTIGNRKYGWSGNRRLGGIAAPWLMAASSAGLGLGAVEATLPLDLVRQLHLSATTIGLLFAVLAASFTAASLGGGWLSDRWRRGPVLAMGWGIVAITLMLIGFRGSVLGQASTLALLGFGLGAMVATIMPALCDALQTAGVDRVGSAAAAYNFSFAAGLMTGAPLTGWLSNVLSFPDAAVLVGLATLVWGVLALLVHALRSRWIGSAQEAPCTPI